MVDLANGCSYAFPPKLVQDLEGAAPADLADVRVDGVGFKRTHPVKAAWTA